MDPPQPVLITWHDPLSTCEVLTSESFLASWTHLQTEAALLSGTLLMLQEHSLQRFAPQELLLPNRPLEGEGISVCLGDQGALWTFNEGGSGMLCNVGTTPQNNGLSH